MRVWKKRKALLALLLTVALAFGILMTSASAASASSTIKNIRDNKNYTDIFKKTNVSATIKVADVKNAGTDSDIYLKVYYSDGITTDQNLLDKSNYNDFERKDNDTYTVTVNHPAWMIKSIGIYNSGKDALCIDSVSVSFLCGGTTVYSVWRNANNTWIETQKKSKHANEFKFDIGDGIKRNMSDADYTAFNATFDRTITLTDIPLTAEQNPSSHEDKKYAYSGSTDCIWVDQWYGMLSSNDSNYGMHQYRYFNAMELDGRPDLSYTITGKGKPDSNGKCSTVTYNTNMSQTIGGTSYKLFEDVKKNDRLIGFKFVPAAVAAQMAKDGVNRLEVKVTLSFSGSDGVKGTTSVTKTFVINRSTFELDEPQITNSVFRDDSDANGYAFINSGSGKQIKIKLPVLSGANSNNYDTATILKNMTFGSGGYARLYYADGKYLTGSLEKSNGVTYVTFDASKASEANQDSTFDLILELHNLESSCNGATYTLTRTVTSAVGLSFESKPDTSKHIINTTYKKTFSGCRLDTKKPSVAIAVDSSEAVTINGEYWYRKLPVTMTPQNLDRNERLYPVKTGRPQHRKDTYYIKLLRGSGTEKTEEIGSMAGYKYTFDMTKMSSPYESREFYVVAEGYDEAGNAFTSKYGPYNVDTTPPEVSMSSSGVKMNGTEKMVTFTFDIKDITGTAKVWYCFVPDGSTVPSKSAKAGETGEISDISGQWAFVQQNSSLGTTVVLRVPSNKSFSGKLYYYGEDALGNATAQRTQNVSVLNQAAEAQVVVEQSNFIKNDYQITITPAAGCKVYYRWATPGFTYGKTDIGMTEYRSGANVGSGYTGETYTNGDKIYHTGQKVLEYMVRNTISGNETYFTGGAGIIVNFDNSLPTIELKQLSSGLSAASQSFSVRASDLSGIASASYEFIPVGSQTATASGSFEVDESGMLNTTLNTAEIGLPNGRYTLKVTVKDRNFRDVDLKDAGATTWTTEESEPFSIRSEAPDVDFTVNGEAYEEGDVIVTNDSGYSVELNVSELFSGTGAAQTVICRVSDDGFNWLDWMTIASTGDAAHPFKADAGKLTAAETLDTPIAPEEGDNLLYIQLACVEADKNLRREEPTNGTVVTVGPIVVMADMTRPVVRLNPLTRAATNSAVGANLTVSDNFTEIPTVGYSYELDGVTHAGTFGVDSDPYLTLTPRTTSDPENPDTMIPLDNAYMIEFRVADEKTVDGELRTVLRSGISESSQLPDSIRVIVTDDVGNETKTTLAAALLDIVPPQATFTYPNPDVDGGRTDAFIKVTCTDPDLDSMYYTIETVSGAEPTEQNRIIEPNDNGYSFTFRGCSGRYRVSVTVTDKVGNTKVYTSDAVTVRYPDVLNMDFVAPVKASDTAYIQLTFNAPVCVLPQSMVTGVSADDTEAAITYAAAQARAAADSNDGIVPDDFYKTVVNHRVQYDGTGKTTFTIYAADEFGNVLERTIKPNTEFGTDFNVTVSETQGTKVEYWDYILRGDSYEREPLTRTELPLPEGVDPADVVSNPDVAYYTGWRWDENWEGEEYTTWIAIELDTDVPQQGVVASDGKIYDVRYETVMGLDDDYYTRVAAVYPLDDKGQPQKEKEIRVYDAHIYDVDDDTVFIPLSWIENYDFELEDDDGNRYQLLLDTPEDFMELGYYGTNDAVKFLVGARSETEEDYSASWQPFFLDANGKPVYLESAYTCALYPYTLQEKLTILPKEYDWEPLNVYDEDDKGSVFEFLGGTYANEPTAETEDAYGSCEAENGYSRLVFQTKDQWENVRNLQKLTLNVGLLYRETPFLGKYQTTRTVECYDPYSWDPNERFVLDLTDNDFTLVKSFDFSDLVFYEPDISIEAEPDLEKKATEYNAVLRADGYGSEIAAINVYKFDESEESYLVYTADGTGERYMTDEDEGFEASVNGGLTELRLRFTENGLYDFEVVDEYGLKRSLWDYEEFFEIRNIAPLEDVLEERAQDDLDDGTITELPGELAEGTDYTLTYDTASGYEADNEVIATLTATDAGLARGLTATEDDRLIVNPDGSWSVCLTPDEYYYAFLLADNYGKTGIAEAEVNPDERFDFLKPVVTVGLFTDSSFAEPLDLTAKMHTVVRDADGTVTGSNPLYLRISAADAQTGIASVTVNGTEVTLSGGCYVYPFDDNGSYRVSVRDNAGNQTAKSVVITGIDNTLPAMTADFSIPQITDLSGEYSLADYTIGAVTATLSFSKPDVRVLSVEKENPASSAEETFSFNITNNTITFTGNDTATVTFVDAYGNEAQDVVTVNTIFNEPPQMQGHYALDAEELSAAITFDLALEDNGLTPKDKVRKLTDLYISQNGVVYPAEYTDGEGSVQHPVFTVRNNGVYTFRIFDDLGLTQAIRVTVAGIDKNAPVITAVTWSYTNAQGQTIEGSLTNPESAGYRIGAKGYGSNPNAGFDKTNGDVTVVITTDSNTSQIGAYDQTRVREHELIYEENGMFVFNMEKANGLTAYFGVDVEIIDKTAPEITFANGDTLMFIEGKLAAPGGGELASLDEWLLDYTAIDYYLDAEKDYSASVIIDYGGLDPLDLTGELKHNVFDKNKPYTVTYTVTDDAGNTAVVRRTVNLIGMNDVLITVNGAFPDAAGKVQNDTGIVKLDMINFAGTAYVKHEEDLYTMGQMKSRGTTTNMANGSQTFEGLDNGWHTFYVQTDMHDYFNISVYVMK